MRVEHRGYITPQGWRRIGYAPWFMQPMTPLFPGQFLQCLLLSYIIALVIAAFRNPIWWVALLVFVVFSALVRQSHENSGSRNPTYKDIPKEEISESATWTAEDFEIKVHN